MSDLNLNFELYRRLLLIRRAEELIGQHYARNEMKTPMHMSMGQEAIAVGVCWAIGLEGQVLASYRSHAAYIAKTNETDRFFAELYGRVTGTAQGKAGSMHLSDPDQGHLGSSAVVASSIPAAIGAAFANKYNANGKIVAVFFGEGAMDEGVFWESLNAACVMKLPVIFVCEDNGWAVHTPPSVRQGYSSIPKVVGGFDCRVFSSDTTDVEEIYRISTEAIDSIRKTGQPAFLHLQCYRYLEHVGTGKDFDAGYRSEDEYRAWFARDPLRVARAKLLGMGQSEEGLMAFEAAIQAEVHASMEKAKAAPLPAGGELSTAIFS